MDIFKYKSKEIYIGELISINFEYDDRIIHDMNNSFYGKYAIIKVNVDKLNKEVNCGKKLMTNKKYEVILKEKEEINNSCRI